MNRSEKPEWISDLYRHEKCAVCGRAIAYAHFDTAIHPITGYWEFIHSHCGR